MKLNAAFAILNRTLRSMLPQISASAEKDIQELVVVAWTPVVMESSILPNVMMET